MDLIGNGIEVSKIPNFEDAITNINNMIHMKHFINPHLFWFEKVEIDNFFKQQRLKALEENLKLYVDNYSSGIESRNFNKNCKIGDTVVVQYVAWRRYVRGSILHKITNGRQDEALIWLIDYGYPMHVKMINLYPLSGELKNFPTNIKCGGIANVMPAEIEYDFVESCLVTIKQDNWLQKACVMVEKLLQDAVSVNFNFRFNRTTIQRNEIDLIFDHNWGDLIVTNKKYKKINVQQFLESSHYAVIIKEIEFVEICSNHLLESTKIPIWLTNDRNNKFNNFNFKHIDYMHSDIDEKEEKKIIDSPIQQKHKSIKRFSNQKGNKIEKVCVKPTTTRNKIEDFWNTNSNCNLENDTSYETFSEKVEVSSKDDTDYYNELSCQHNLIGKAGSMIKPNEKMIKQMRLPHDDDFSMVPVNKKINYDIYDITRDDDCLNSDDDCLSNFRLLSISSRLYNYIPTLDNKNFVLVKKSTNLVEENENDEPNRNLRQCQNQRLPFDDVNEHISTSPDETSIKDFTNDNNLTNMNIYPAGFDMTRLYKYRNPDQHWHRKKTTRFDISSHQFYENKKVLSKEFKSLGTQNKPKVHSWYQNTLDNNIKFNNPSTLNGSENLYSNNCSQIINKARDDIVNAKLDQKMIHINSESFPTILNIPDEINLKTKFIDHLVLTHTKCALKPIEHFDEVDFIPNISKQLKNITISKIFRVQVHSWTHIMDGNSYFVINPRQSGKTCSYLPAVCNQLWKESQKPSLEKTYGPNTILIVSSAKEVEELQVIITLILSQSNVKVVTSFGIHNLTETKVELLNGCDILITTVSSLNRILIANNDENLINGDILIRVIVDNMDKMLARYCKEFYGVVNALKKICWNRKAEKQILAPQFIVTSKDWSEWLLHLIKLTHNPLLVIGDFLEAAVYGKTKISIKLCAKESKDKVLIKFIQKLMKSRRAASRTLIVCRNDNEIQHLSKVLWQNGYSSISYTTNSMENDRQAVNEWQYLKISSPIVICADAQLKELRIQKAQILIHYTLSATWTAFNDRFSTIIHNYSIFNEKLNEPNYLVPLSVIFLDEENNQQLPRLVDFMEKHNQLVHPHIIAVTKNIRLEQEKLRQKKGIELCEQILEFGECIDRDCKQRHSLVEQDVNNKYNLPENGILSLYILEVYSPTYYMARLIKHKDNSFTTENDNNKDNKWKTIRRSDEVLTFSVELNLYYDDKKNLIPHWPPLLNDICIYKFNDSYQRARIIKEPNTDYNLNIQHSELLVELKLIDIGKNVYFVKCSDIYKCAEQFKEFPIQAIGIRLSNIVPFDNERTWNKVSTRKVCQWLIDDVKNNSNHVIHADINFILSETIWVNNIVVLESLKTVDTYSQVINVRKALVAINYGMFYKSEKCAIKKQAYHLQLELSEKNNSSDTSNDDFQDIFNKEDIINNSNIDTTSIYENGLSDTNFKTEMITLKTDKNNYEIDENVSVNHKNSTNLNPLHDIDDRLLLNVNNNRFHKENDKSIVNYQLKDDENNFAELNETNQENPNISSESRNSAKTESWCKINKNQLIKVEFFDDIENGNWENFFVQIYEENEKKIFNELTLMINKHIENLESKNENIDLMNIHPLGNFIIYHEEYYFRAKLCGVFGSKANERIFRFFLCDGACMVYVKENDLNNCCYPTSDEIVHYTPYQSIHCQLIGIKWDPYKDRCPLLKKHCFIYSVMNELEMIENDSTIRSVKHGMDINSYSVLLFECDEDDDKLQSIEMINTKLILKSKLHSDFKTEHFLNLDIDLIKQSRVREYKTENNLNKKNDESKESNNNDNNTSFDEKKEEEKEKERIFNNFIECLQQSTPNDILNFFEGIANEMNQDYDDQSLQITEITEKDDQNLQLTKSDDSIKNNMQLMNYVHTDSTIPSFPLLKVLYKPLTTTWFETDWMLVFYIYAPNIVDYDLQVKNQVLLFGTKDDNGMYAFILHLLGKVRPEKTSHEVRGSYVVVRLVKNSYGIWPRLLKHKVNYTWLTYDYSVMESNEKIMIERSLPKTIISHNVSDDNDDKGSNSDSDESDNLDDVDRYS